MNYYQISFHYPGPYSNQPDFAPEACSANLAASKAARKAMDDCDLEYKFAYAYPDGSLYYWVRTHMGDDDLWHKLAGELTGTDIAIEKIIKDDPNSDPHKGQHTTLKAYFDAPTVMKKILADQEE